MKIPGNGVFHQAVFLFCPSLNSSGGDLRWESRVKILAAGFLGSSLVYPWRDKVTTWHWRGVGPTVWEPGLLDLADLH